ncbi:hypothetical protein BDZ45DRAFT_87596 [Acephala macrosclerotiorum]|nr:hypothetical protein BDZ45DRAFT_87596 [Acephala macrosclerotiorum]
MKCLYRTTLFPQSNILPSPQRWPRPRPMSIPISHLAQYPPNSCACGIGQQRACIWFVNLIIGNTAEQLTLTLAGAPRPFSAPASAILLRALHLRASPPRLEAAAAAVVALTTSAVIGRSRCYLPYAFVT